MNAERMKRLVSENKSNQNGTERNGTELAHVIYTTKAKGIPPSMNHPHCINIRFDPSQETQD
jgi:hypothetical protein